MWKFFASTGSKALTNEKDFFKYKWLNTKEIIEVRDPLYNQKHMATIFEVHDEDIDMRFAATEFSNNIWGFYLWEDE